MDMQERKAMARIFVDAFAAGVLQASTFLQGSRSTKLLAANAPPVCDSLAHYILPCTPGARYASLAGKGTESRVEDVQRAFAEAREELELAREEAPNYEQWHRAQSFCSVLHLGNPLQAVKDAGTIYFNDSADDARKLVSQVLKAYEEVLQSSSEAEQGQLQRSMGLKMEQLKAEVQELDHMHDDD